MCSITEGAPSGIDVGHSSRPTIRPTKIPTPRPIPLYPVISSTIRSTTHVPSSDSLVNNTSGFETIATIDNNFIQDDEGISLFALKTALNLKIKFLSDLDLHFICSYCQRKIDKLNFEKFLLK